MRRLVTRAFAVISLVVMVCTGPKVGWAESRGGEQTTGRGFVEAPSRGSFSESAQFLPIIDVFAEDEARAGWSVDVDGPTAVLGAPLADVVNLSLQSDAGVVFVQVFDGFSWTQQRRLVSDDPDAEDRFGWAVGISGDTVVVGAPQDDDAGLDAGAVHVFVRTGSTWSEQAKLTAGDAAASDLFGNAVAIDGDTVVVGAQEDDNGNGTNAGAVYVYVRSGTVWSQQVKLVPSDASGGIQFGNAVSVDVNTLIAGCELDNDLGVGSGSAYIYYRIGTTWVFQGKLTASDGVAYDNFGASVAVSGIRAAVGAPLNDDFGNDSGSAYVFLKSSSWTQERKLTASDAAASEEFGRSVAMDGLWVAVGAQYNTVGPPPGFYGSVYAFTRTGPSLEWTETDRMTPAGATAFDMFGHAVAVSGNRIIGGWPMDERDGATNVGSAAVFYGSGVTWPEQAQLHPDDAAADDNFGSSVSLDGDTAVVGSGGDDHGAMKDAGSVSVFEKTGGSWAFQQRLVAADASAGAYFGSVAVSGVVMIVGAGGDDDNGIQSGSAYAFLRSGSTWTQQDKMTASDGAEYDHFGAAVDIDANIAVIGAYGGDVGPDSSGVAYVFTGTGSSWTEDARLVPPDPGHGDYFGVTVSVSGTTIAVGAPQDDDHGSLSGSVYIYYRHGSTWTFQSKLTASDADDYDRFGWSVALSGDTLLVGAYNDEAASPSGGSAYIFTRSGSTWSEQTKLLASVSTGADNFGMGVALEGDTAAVGARYHDVGPGYEEGAVFIFDRDGGLWTEQQIVAASDRSTLDSFGQVVSVSPTVLLGGARRREMNNTPYVGAAYVFDRALDCNLFVIKDDGLSSVTVGQEITYTIVVGNEGSGDAFGSTITDTFPGDLIDCSWTCFVGGGATCTAGPVSGDIIDTPDLPVGSEATYVATCTVGPTAVGTLSNTVTVDPPPGVIDSDPSDNTATDLDTVIGQADLSIVKDNQRREIVETHRTTYAIWVFNPSPSDVVDAHVSDAFPPELTDCQWACVYVPPGGSCTAGPVTGDVDDLVTIPSGDSIVYAASCTVAAASGTCSNSATVAPPAGTIDPDPSDNSSTDSDHITALADFIFEDGFDDGSTTAWSMTVPPIVLREVVREVLPDQHTAAFRLDLEALEPLGRFAAPVAAGYTSAKEAVFVLMLRRDEEGFAVRARVWSDDGSSETTEWVALPSPVDDIELRWLRSLPGLENGRAELYVDGLAPAVIDAVDNDERVLAASAVAVRMDGVPVTTGSRIWR